MSTFSGFFKGDLILTIHRAAFTVDLDTFRKMDPYCYIEIGNFKERTSAKSGAGKNPIWEETFQLRLDGLAPQIMFECYDKHNLEKDELIGSGCIPLVGQAPRAEPIQIELFNKHHKNVGALTATVSLALDGYESTATNAMPQAYQQAPQQAQPAAYQAPAPQPTVYAAPQQQQTYIDPNVGQQIVQEERREERREEREQRRDAEFRQEERAEERREERFEEGGRHHHHRE